MKNDCHISIPSMKKAGTVRFSLLLSWPPLGGAPAAAGGGESFISTKFNLLLRSFRLGHKQPGDQAER